jgi:two-component system sensor histidine kinase AlgZ
VLLSLIFSSLLAVLRYGLAGFNAITFGPLALLVLWLTLLSAFWLCLLHPIQSKLQNWSLTTVSLVGIVLITALSSWAFNLWMGTAIGLQQLPLASVGENTLIAFLLAVLILRFLAVHAQLQRRDLQLAEARFDALQARIKPHFLFNTLNSIAALISLRPAAAETALLDLSDMLRSSIGRENPNWTLADEADICVKYLGIEKLRMGDRLTWKLELPEAAGRLRFPQLALQPLVENAVLHGIQQNPRGGSLSLSVELRDPNLLHIELRNTAASRDEHAGSGQALANIEARLQTFFKRVRHFERRPEGEEYIVRMELELD